MVVQIVGIRRLWLNIQINGKESGGYAIVHPRK
jgi:hypothetical protein